MKQYIAAVSVLSVLVFYPLSALAETGSYTPPEDISGLMGSGGDNGYGLGSLMAQQGAASASGTPDSTHSSSVLNTVTNHSDSRAAAARKMLKVKNQQLETKVTDLTTKLADMQHQVDERNTQLQSMQTQLTQAGKAAEVALDSDPHKEAYVVGQAMAASLREKLTGYAAAGVSPDIAQITAGLSDGLNNRMRLKREEMDSAYGTFAHKVQAGVSARVKESEATIAKKFAGHKPDLVADGMSFLVVKKGSPVKDADAPRSLALTESLNDGGKVISMVPHLTLSADDDMPPVVRDALPLLGPGAVVETWALASTVYGNGPLPKGVAPFTVLHYQLKGLASK